MLKKIYLIAAFALITTFAFAQTGSLKGVITDAMSGEPIPFANIVAERNGNQIGGTTTDFDGNYTIKPLEPGSYTLKATFVGYGTVEITGVVISANKITNQNVKLQEGIAIGEVKIIEFKNIEIAIIQMMKKKPGVFPEKFEGFYLIMKEYFLKNKDVILSFIENKEQNQKHTEFYIINIYNMNVCINWSRLLKNYKDLIKEIV